jgi:hypothetical protein
MLKYTGKKIHSELLKLVTLLDGNPRFTSELHKHGLNTKKLVELYQLARVCGYDIHRTHIEHSNLTLYYFDKDYLKAFYKMKRACKKHTYWIEYGAGILNGDYTRIKGIHDKYR